MYTVSTGFHDAIMSGKPQRLKLTFGDNQVAEQNLSISGLTYSAMAFEGEELTIGAACSAELGVDLLNFDGELSSFNFDGTEFTASIGVLVGEEYEYVPLGVFISEKPDKLKPKKISITAHDRMVKFDVSADDFLNSLTYPTTLKSIFTALCTYVGVPASTADFPNSGKTFNSQLYRTQNVLCREVLQWIAEAAGAFARISRTGTCELTWFADADVTFNKTTGSADYYNAVVSEYQVAKIDKLQVAASEKDIGVIVGTGTNAYQIIDCPMLYGYTDAEIRPYAQVIYDRLNSFAAFTPVELDAKGDWSLEPGDTIKVVTDDGTYTFPIYRMDLTYKGKARIQYISSGSPSRPAISAENRRTLIAGRASHEIETTVEGLKETVSRVSFLTPVESDTDPSTEWDDDQKTANTGYQWYDGSVIKVWTGEAWQTVINPTYNQTATPTGAESGDYWYNPSTKKIKRYTGSAWVVDTTVCMPTTWTQNMQAQIKITAEGISSMVTKDNIVSTINQSAEAVTINASKVNLSGYVTITSLKTSGRTTINGDNITTGTVAASRIDVDGLYVKHLNGADGTFSGTLSAVTGTFNSLDAVGGKIHFGSNYIDVNGVGIGYISGFGDISIVPQYNTGGYGNIGAGSYYWDQVKADKLYYVSSCSKTSARRYKKNIENLTDAEAGNIDDIRLITYQLKDDKSEKRQMGVIAEEIETVCPYVVSYLDGQPEAVDYSALSILAIKEIQKLRKRVAKLEEA